MSTALRRLLLLLVVLALGLLGWRIARGPATPDADVSILRPDARDLIVRGFTLAQPARVPVEAVGAVGETDSLEVVAWLLDATTRALVWEMSAANGKRLDGALVRVRDTLDLPAGRYELFLSTYGRGGARRGALARVFDPSAKWRNDIGRTYVTLGLGASGTWQSHGALDASSLVDGRLRSQADDTPPADTSVLWRARTSENRFTGDFLVQNGGVLDLAFVGHATGAHAATAEILDANDRVVWTLAGQTAEALPRGYQRVAARVPLADGIYHLRFDGNDVGPGAWRQHPPVDPLAWGLVVRAAEGRVLPFDQFEGLPLVLRITADRPSTRWEVPFEVLDTARVFVSALGEITDGDAVYDGGGLYRADGSRVWELTGEDTRQGGGVSKNRAGTALLTLAPGRYVARFFTDGSHHLGSFNSESSTPTHPERWGLTVFSLTDPARIRVGTPQDKAMSEAPPPAAPEAAPGAAARPGEVLAAIENVRNDDRDEAAFVLAAPAKLIVESASEAGDDMWITDARGETVWTADDVEEVDDWRIAKAPLDLPAGTYTLHVRADGSTAAVTFSEQTGRPKRDYGIRVRRAG